MAMLTAKEAKQVALWLVHIVGPGVPEKRTYSTVTAYNITAELLRRNGSGHTN